MAPELGHEHVVETMPLAVCGFEFVIGFAEDFAHHRPIGCGLDAPRDKRACAPLPGIRLSWCDRPGDPLRNRDPRGWARNAPHRGRANDRARGCSRVIEVGKIKRWQHPDEHHVRGIDDARCRNMEAIQGVECEKGMYRASTVTSPSLQCLVAPDRAGDHRDARRRIRANRRPVGSHRCGR